MPDYPPPVSLPKLLDHIWGRVRRLGYAKRTEISYVHWIKRYILFHGKRHSRDMGKAGVEAFLTSLAVERNVAAHKQNLALSAILFLYRVVLAMPLPWLEEVARAKKPARLRVKDLDFAMNQINVRDGKGDKDRVTMLPQSLVEALRRHLVQVKARHGADLAGGMGARATGRQIN